jgi:TonB family protein
MPSTSRLGILCVTTLLLTSPLCAQQTSALDDYNALATATKLDREGARPFHLKMEAQIFDLKGEPAETGTVEEWWLSPNQFRIEINSRNLHEVILTGEPDQVVPGVHRSEFLLRQMLTNTVNPLYKLNTAENVSETAREIGGHKLSCFAIAPSGKSQLGRDTTYCREPGGDNVRLIVSPYYTAVRNNVGTFGPTNVAQDVSLSYLGRPAIRGKVILLQPYDAAAAGSPVLHVSGVYNSDPQIPTPAIVAGHFKSGLRIDYPLYARHEHISGVVLLACHITKEGKVDSSDVIASSNSIFDEAAKTGVLRWLFDPFTLNGHPVSTKLQLPITFYGY